MRGFLSTRLIRALMPIRFLKRGRFLRNIDLFLKVARLNLAGILSRDCRSEVVLLDPLP